MVPGKGGNEYAIKALVTWTEELGWEKVTIQADEEHSLSRLYEVKRRLPGRVDVRKSGETANEMVNGFIGGNIRTWLAEINESYSLKVNCDHCIFPWVARQCVDIGQVSHQQQQNHTVQSHQRSWLHWRDSPVWGDSDGKVSKDKWKGGTPMGERHLCRQNSNSDEHLVLAESGAQKYRSVRRLPKGSQYQKATFEQIRERLGTLCCANLMPSHPAKRLYKFQRWKARSCMTSIRQKLSKWHSRQVFRGVDTSFACTAGWGVAARRSKERRKDASGQRWRTSGDRRKEPKRAKIEQPMASEPEMFNIATPAAEMSRASSKEASVGEEAGADSRDFIAAVANGEQWKIGTNRLTQQRRPGMPNGYKNTKCASRVKWLPERMTWGSSMMRMGHSSLEIKENSQGNSLYLDTSG